jgi:hypothetical protein
VAAAVLLAIDSFSFWAWTGRSIIRLEREKREALSMLEIAAMDPREEEQQRPGHEDQADEDQHHDHFHGTDTFERRVAVSETTPAELRGMRTAATTGVTTPAKHRASAATI